MAVRGPTTGTCPFGGGLIRDDLLFFFFFYRNHLGRADLSGVPAPRVLPLDLRAGPGSLAPPVGRMAQAAQAVSSTCPPRPADPYNGISGFHADPESGRRTPSFIPAGFFPVGPPRSARGSTSSRRGRPGSGKGRSPDPGRAGQLIPARPGKQQREKKTASPYQGTGRARGATQGPKAPPRGRNPAPGICLGADPARAGPNTAAGLAINVALVALTVV